MFDIAPSELMIVALVAIVLIGPKDLPRVMRVVGQWVGKGRAMMRQVHGAVDEMIREAEVQETAKKWRTENARILLDHSAAVETSAIENAPPSGMPTQGLHAFPFAQR
jgi:sec-independent protein translocase protein TatB